MGITTRGPRGTDPILLVEVLLGLILFGLFVYLFLVPVARPPFTPQWWAIPLVGSVFFGLVGLDAWRRKRARHAEHSAVRQEIRGRSSHPDEPIPPTV